MTLNDWIQGAIDVITMAVPALLSLIFVVFIINIIRFFILQSGSEAGREKARSYILWSILGFVVVIALWGIVALLMNIAGITGGGGATRTDYEFNIYRDKKSVDKDTADEKTDQLK
jgi:ABC-type multidrug transport system fused ATPase/permease subunit